MLSGLFGADPLVEITINSNPQLDEYRKGFSEVDQPSLGKGDIVTGTLEVTPPPGKTVSHRGISLTVFGDFRLTDGTQLNRFYARTQHLAPIGDLTIPLKTDFKFDTVKFPASTYIGPNILAVYGVELRVVHRISDFVKEKQFFVFLFDDQKKEATPIHNEVGITNVLHIEFVFPHGVVNFNDCVVGAAYFILVKLRVVHCSISLYQNEEYQSAGKYLKKRTIVKTIEIMDGAPVRGDYIPIRFFLGDCNVWPFQSFKDSDLKVETYLRITLIDENGKKYYKRTRVKIDRLPPIA